MDSVGIYWIPLRINMIPFLDREVDQVIQKFFDLREQASKGNTQAVKNFELLKISVNARIEDYDHFFNKKFMDQRISFLEKQKYRLKRLIYDSQQEAKENQPAKELFLGLQSQMLELEQKATEEQQRKLQKMQMTKPVEPEVKSKSLLKTRGNVPVKTKK